MYFVWPVLAGLFLVLPFIAVQYFQRTRKQYRLAEKYFPGQNRHSPVPFFLFLLTVSFGILGAMRPVVHFTVLANQALVIFAIDVSGSMDASDIQPSRLEAAKVSIENFFEQQDSTVLIVLVAFSETAALIQSPTNEHDLLKNSIKRLEPLSGTAIGSAIEESLKAINEYYNVDNNAHSDQYLPAVIILLTDGQSNSGTPTFEAVEKAVKEGIKIYTVGIGKKSSISLDEQTLKEIAEKTDGKYYRVGNEQELYGISAWLGGKDEWLSRYVEISFAFAGLSLLVLLASLRLNGLL